MMDNVSRNDQGISWLTDIPIPGFLSGTQNNTCARAELPVLVTPTIIRGEAEARC